MRFCDKLLLLRRRQGYSQEQLADLLGISRQSVSKWESGQAMPELVKIIQISNLFSVSVDDLVRDETELELETASGTNSRDNAVLENTHTIASEATDKVSDEELLKNLEEMKDSLHQISKTVNTPAGFEYKSSLTVCGIPLVHIHFSKIFRAGVFHSNRACVAKGIFAAGDIAFGVVSFGAFSIGVIPIGALSFGLFSIGAVAVGVVALGVSAIGIYSVGAAALGLRAAAGISASARTAIGTSEAKGLYEMVAGPAHRERSAIVAFLLSHTPEMPGWLAHFMSWFVW